MIANGPTLAASITAHADGAGWYFLNQTFTGMGTPTYYLPTSGLINSANTTGLNFQLADASLQTAGSSGSIGKIYGDVHYGSAATRCGQHIQDPCIHRLQNGNITLGAQNLTDHRCHCSQLCAEQHHAGQQQRQLFGGSNRTVRQQDLFGCRKHTRCCHKTNSPAIKYTRRR